MQGKSVNWAAIDADPRFQRLHRKKTRFLVAMMSLAVICYFLLPLGAACFQPLFRTRIWGPLNVGMLCALAQFVFAWAIAWAYSRKANAEFDAMAAELVREADRSNGQ
ncbi:DUF485 domain-containing protein [Niveibacterium sp. SC-1]|uniref:DUF485 domain-containing protein n=1 Tax=Niveibacterium sp. SC-1 TaxID=3135646 RepID=UPI00311FC295